MGTISIANRSLTPTQLPPLLWLVVVVLVVAAGYDPIGTSDRKWGGKLLFAMEFHAIYYLLIDHIALRAKAYQHLSPVQWVAIKRGCLREFIVKGGEGEGERVSIDPEQIADRHHHMGPTVLFD